MGSSHSKMTGPDDVGQDPSWFGFPDNWAVFAEDSRPHHNLLEAKTGKLQNYLEKGRNIHNHSENAEQCKGKSYLEANEDDNHSKCSEEDVQGKEFTESVSPDEEIGEIKRQAKMNASPNTGEQLSNTITERTSSSEKSRRDRNRIPPGTSDDENSAQGAERDATTTVRISEEDKTSPIKMFQDTKESGCQNSTQASQDTKKDKNQTLNTRNSASMTKSLGNCPEHSPAIQSTHETISTKVPKAQGKAFLLPHETRRNGTGVEIQEENLETKTESPLHQNRQTNLELGDCCKSQKSPNFQTSPKKFMEVSRNSATNSQIQDRDMKVLVHTGPKSLNVSETSKKPSNQDDQRFSFIHKITDVLKAPSLSFHLGLQGKDARGDKDHNEDEGNKVKQDSVGDEDEDEEGEDDDEDEEEDDDEEEEGEEDEEEEDDDDVDNDDEVEDKYGRGDDKSKTNQKKDKEEEKAKNDEKGGMEDYINILSNFVRKAVSREDVGPKAKLELEGQNDIRGHRDSRNIGPKNSEAEGPERDDAEQKRARSEKVLEHKHNAYIESIAIDSRAKGRDKSPVRDTKDSTIRKVIENGGIKPNHEAVSMKKSDQGEKPAKKETEKQSNKPKDKESHVKKEIHESEDVTHHRDQKWREEVKGNGDKSLQPLDSRQNADKKRKSPPTKDGSKASKSNLDKKSGGDVSERAWAWKPRTGFESRGPKHGKLGSDGNNVDGDGDDVRKNEELLELLAGSLLEKKEEMAKISSKYRGYGEGLGDAISIDFSKGKLLFGWPGESIEAEDYDLESKGGADGNFSVGKTSDPSLDFYNINDSTSRVDSNIKDISYSRYDEASSDHSEEKTFSPSRLAYGSPERQGESGHTRSSSDKEGYWVEEGNLTTSQISNNKVPAGIQRSMRDHLPHDYIAKEKMREEERRRREACYFQSRKQRKERNDTRWPGDNNNAYANKDVVGGERGSHYRNSTNQQIHGSHDRKRSPGSHSTYFGAPEKHPKEERGTFGQDLSRKCERDTFFSSATSHSSDLMQRQETSIRYYAGETVETPRSPSYHGNLLKRGDNTNEKKPKQFRSVYFDKTPHSLKMAPMNFLVDSKASDSDMIQEQTLDYDDDASVPIPDFCAESFARYDNLVLDGSHCEQRSAKGSKRDYNTDGAQDDSTADDGGYGEDRLRQKNQNIDDVTDQVIYTDISCPGNYYKVEEQRNDSVLKPDLTDKAQEESSEGDGGYSEDHLQQQNKKFDDVNHQVTDADIPSPENHCQGDEQKIDSVLEQDLTDEAQKENSEDEGNFGDNHSQQQSENIDDVTHDEQKSDSVLEQNLTDEAQEENSEDEESLCDSHSQQQSENIDDVTHDHSRADVPSSGTWFQSENRNMNHNASTDWSSESKKTKASPKAEETSKIRRIVSPDMNDSDPSSKVRDIFGRLAGQSGGSLSIIGKHILAVSPWRSDKDAILNFKPETETRIIQELWDVFFMAESPFLCFTMAFMSLFMACNKQKVIFEKSVPGGEGATAVTNWMDTVASLSSPLRCRPGKTQHSSELSKNCCSRRSGDKSVVGERN